MIRTVVVTTALLVGIVVFVAYGQRQTPAMRQVDQLQVAAIAQPLMTRCVGDYVLELPQAFALNAQSYAQINGARITVIPESLADFERRYAERREALEAQIQVGSGFKHLRETLALNDDHPGGIYDRASSDVSGTRAWRTLELWGWKQGYAIHAAIEAVDNTFPEDKDDTYLRQRGNEVPTKRDTLRDLFDRTTGRDDDSLPAAPGLCIANGLIRRSHEVPEQVHIAYHLQGTADVFLTFNQWNDLRESTSLLQRSGEIESGMAASGARTVRKSAITLAGHSYETWLVAGPTVDDIAGTTFTLHGNETIGTTEAPFAQITLFNGTRIPDPTLTSQQKRERPRLQAASLSVAQAVALWDAFVPTLRPWTNG